MNYKRNPDKLREQLVKTASGQIFCKTDCYIHTPVRYVEKKLSSIGVRTYVFGWAPVILVTGEYCVLNICGRIEINPYKVNMVTINGADYYEFFFPANTPIIVTENVVQDDKIIYFIVDEHDFLAKVPWFMNYEDVGKLLDSSRKYADSRAAEVLEVPEVMAAVMGRDKDDERVYLRHVLDKYKNKASENVQFVPLTSVHLSVTGAINRIAGNFFEPAVEGEIVSPSKNVDEIEKLLRA